MIRRSYSEYQELPTQGLFINSSHQFALNFQPLAFSTAEIGQPIIKTILKEHFKHSSYPSKQHLNPFCPFCLKYIKPEDDFLTSFQPYFQKTYMAHPQCLQKHDTNCLTTLLDDSPSIKIQKYKKTQKTHSLMKSQCQSYIQLQLSHNISGKILAKLNKKLCQNVDSKIQWNFKNQNNDEDLSPNIILFPFPDFDIKITKTSLKTSKKSTIKSFVNTQKRNVSQNQLFVIKNEQFQLVAKKVYQKQEIDRLIDQMNYKYRFAVEHDLPAIQLMSLTICDNYEEEDHHFICPQENYSITQLLNQNDSESSFLTSSQKQNHPFYHHYSCSQQTQRDKVNLPALIKSHQLGQFVRNSIQSRYFQSFLEKATQKQINQIIDSLQSDVRQLVTHEYANYMMQKLFARCNQDQRLRIIKQLLFELPNIALSTQGTHTLQYFVPLLTQKEEQRLIVQKITTNFFELSRSENSTHFIQKIVTFFPIQTTTTFFKTALNNFLNFATSKNSICVLKRMIKKIKESEEQKIYFITDLKKQFMNKILNHFNEIFPDLYGNYVVQFYYQYFSSGCQQLTQLILTRFRQYSIQKYSGNAVYKCVSTYWNLNKVEQRLRNILKGHTILDLYRCKEGNKVLLTIMEKSQDVILKEEIYNQLVLSSSSKYQNDRWNLLLGCRSSTTITQSSFSQVVKNTAQKKKH